MQNTFILPVISTVSSKGTFSTGKAGSIFEIDMIENWKGKNVLCTFIKLQSRFVKC
jgi:hypothetical protein